MSSDVVDRAAKIIGDNLLTRLAPNEEYIRGRTIAEYLQHHGLLTAAASGPVEQRVMDRDALAKIIWENADRQIGVMQAGYVADAVLAALAPASEEGA